MNKKRFFAFSILIALFSIAGVFVPVNARVNTFFLATTPTPKPALKTAIFDLNTANKIPPSDILNQISYSGRGGGESCKPISYTTPTIVEKSKNNIELMESAYMAVCGWAKNEKLTGSVTFPNGQTQTLAVQITTSNGNYAGFMKFRPSITDPSGQYTLTMTGKTNSIQTVVNFSIPRQPYIYTLDKNRLLLYGFSPSENIRLFYYSWDLKGWQEYSTGTDGRLEIKTSINIESEGVFIAIGEKTGEVRMKGFLGVHESSITVDGKSLCQNGQPSRVKIGDQAMASFTDGSKLRIRETPGFGGAAAYNVPEGTKMKIVGGPKCADSSTWWKVEVSKDIKGWVAEYWHGNEYLIEPVR